MPSSLGIYIEDDLIKYAKVVKEKDSLKVEAFNVMFYEQNNLAEAIDQVINETYSFKIPICINVSGELYNYYDVFALLNKADVKKSLDIEFDMMCNEKNYNKNSLEARYILMTNKDDNEKVKALHIAANKNDMNRKLQAFGNYKVHSMTPISTSITNIVDVSPKDNIAIINIEKETKITTISEGQIVRVDTIEAGMGQILRDINMTENSMQKAYEVCKNITIYTQDTQSLQSDGSEHLEDVMPTLYKIATESKQIIENSMSNITKVYITGLGTAINNIDLYFQEYMVNLKCELLKPFFVENSSVKISMKDYIEVNSAIALALNGLGYENKELNFISSRVITGQNVNLDQLVKKMFSTQSFKDPLSAGEKMMVRMVILAFVGIIMFCAFSYETMSQIDAKTEEINSAISTAKTQITIADNDLAKITGRTTTYSALINSVNNLSESSDGQTYTRVVRKDSVPNLLNQIMFVIPQKVQVTSIRNEDNTEHIIIEAQSEKYEQLGYFKAVLDSKGVLVNVKSSSGTKDGNIVKVTIEGDMP